MDPLTPSFPMENKKIVEEVSGKSDDSYVAKHIKKIVDPIFKASIPNETPKNHVLVVGVGSGKDYSYAFYNPHNARYYFDFNKWNFNPRGSGGVGCDSFEVVNTSEFLLKDFHGCRIVVKKNLIEITNKINKERLFKIDGSLDNRKVQTAEALATLEKECIEILRSIVSIYGGATSYRCVKVWIPDNKTYHDKIIDTLPDKMTFRNDVVKKVYMEDPKNVEWSDPVYASNYFRNMGLKDYAPEIEKELCSIRQDFNSALDKLSHEALGPLTEQIKLHLEVMAIMKDTQIEQAKTMRAIQESLKEVRVRSIKKEFGW